MSILSIGIDVGKRHDPTAIVIAIAANRVVESQDEKAETHFTIPFLKRIDLGTPYPTQAVELVDIGKRALDQYQFCHQTANSDQRRRSAQSRSSYQPPSLHLVEDRSLPKIYVDITGVGDALVDLLNTQGIASVGTLYPCRFTARDRIIENGNEFSIGKTNFASRLQVLSESKRVHLPSIPEAKALAQEMLDFDIDVDEMSGKATYGAIRPGTHDDMVVALGLACLKDLPAPAPILSVGGSLSPSKWRSMDLNIFGH